MRELPLHPVCVTGSLDLLNGSWCLAENSLEVKDSCTHIIPLRNKEIAITAYY